MDSADRISEHVYLETTLKHLRAAAAAAREALGDADAALAKSAERMWEYGRHVIRDFDDVIELNAHNQLVEVQNRSYDIAAVEVRDIEAMLSSPYFGRIDFTDRTEGDRLTVYIGRRAFINPDALEFFMYDWRSPIASMFYDFDHGSAFYQSPQGVHEGEITLKRQYRIQNGQMEAMFDSDALVQDDILGNILSEQAGRRLKVIAESIQKEQNAAIRYLAPRDTLVIGPAGSGKTSVGMHRAAYLLYHNRGRLNASEIVAISANRVFNEYIAGILPDLYEADIRREVFSDLIARFRPEGVRIRDYYEQTEYLLSARGDDRRARWIAAAYSVDFVRHLKRFADELPIEVSDIVLDGKVIAAKADFQAYMAVDATLGYSARVRRADQFIADQCEDYFNRNKEEVRAKVERRAQDGELDLYTEQEILRHIRFLREDCEARHKRSIRARNGLDATLILKKAVRTYFQERGGDARLAEDFSRRLSRGELEYEDFLALLCAKACAGEIEPMETVRHVLMDEAQDYGAPQHFLLKALFPRAAFTLMADVNQAVLPSIGIADARMFAEMYPGGLELFPLTKSYRSTGPIGALAAFLAARGEKMAYYDRGGAKPVLRRVEDVADGIASIVNAAPFQGTTAILTKTKRAAQRLYERIGGAFAAGLITGSTGEMTDDVMVMPVMMAKGLEFDRVIIAECYERDEPEFLYLMCTRALHELYILHTGASPRALSGARELLDVQF